MNWDFFFGAVWLGLSLRVFLGFRTAPFGRRLAYSGCLAGLCAGGALFMRHLDTPMEYKVIWILAILGAEAVALRRVEKDLAGPPGLCRWVATTREWMDSGVSSIAVAFVLMWFVLQPFRIPSGSMKNTLQIGDHILVAKFSYGVPIPWTGLKIRPFGWGGKPKRGDIVVFRAPPPAHPPGQRDIQRDFIKRCIGLPGEVVEIRDQTVFINGNPLQEPYARYTDAASSASAAIPAQEYQNLWASGGFADMPAEIKERIKDRFGPVVIPPGHYLVLGDNRDQSSDSRFWGPLHEKYIRGKAVFRYWPPVRFGLLQSP